MFLTHIKQFSVNRSPINKSIRGFFFQILESKQFKNQQKRKERVLVQSAQFTFQMHCVWVLTAFIWTLWWNCKGGRWVLCQSGLTATQTHSVSIRPQTPCWTRAGEAAPVMTRSLQQGGGPAEANESEAEEGGGLGIMRGCMRAGGKRSFVERWELIETHSDMHVYARLLASLY